MGPLRGGDRRGESGARLVAANEVALAGVREEAKVGQRTTLDVLNAQQALLSARTQLVRAEHDQVVFSYSLLSTIGRLNVPTLGLAVAEYDPSRPLRPGQEQVVRRADA